MIRRSIAAGLAAILLAGPVAAQGVDVQRLLQQGLQGRDQRQDGQRDAYERGRQDAERDRGGDFDRRREDERRHRLDEERRRDDYNRQRFDEDRARRESGRY